MMQLSIVSIDHTIDNNIKHFTYWLDVGQIYRLHTEYSIENVNLYSTAWSETNKKFSEKWQYIGN